MLPCLRPILLSYVLLALSCAPILTRSDAEIVSRRELVEYAKQESLPLQAFDLVDVDASHPFKWTFVYKSRTQPVHTVVIYVSGSGVSETNRFIGN